MTITFTQEFIIAFDEAMEKEYDNPLPKSDYIGFIYKIEQSLFFNNSEYAYFSNNEIRNNFGRKKIHGKMSWKLDYIIKKLLQNDVIIYSDYDKATGQTRHYYYNSIFIWSIKENQLSFVTEEIPQKLYNRISKEPPTEEKAICQYELLKSDSSLYRFTFCFSNCLTNSFDVRLFENRYLK